MKKIMIIFFAACLMLFSCCRPDEPTPDIKLSKAELVLEVGQGERISLSGGDGKTYMVTPSNSEIAEAVIKGNSLEITARKAGVQTFTIISADRKAPLKVIVNPAPIPEIGTMIGVYDLEGQPLLVYTITARSKNGLWLCEKSQNPYGKRIFLPYYREGNSDLLIIAEGLSPAIENTGDQGKKLTITKEKDLEGGKVQLRSDKLRFIVEKR